MALAFPPGCEAAEAAVSFSDRRSLSGPIRYRVASTKRQTVLTASMHIEAASGRAADDWAHGRHSWLEVHVS